MKAITNEIMESLHSYEDKAKKKELNHTDLEMVKHLCETLFAIDEVKETWEHHSKEMGHEKVHTPPAPATKVY